MDGVSEDALSSAGADVTTSETNDLLIIDGDSHVLEPPDLWDRYLEPEFRPRAIRITRSIPLRDGEQTGIAPLPGQGRRASDIGRLKCRHSPHAKRQCS